MEEPELNSSDFLSNNFSEFHDCDDTNYEEFDLMFRIAGAIAYLDIAISVFGIIANVLAICIFSKKKFKSNFNNLLIALAFCDLNFFILFYH